MDTNRAITAHTALIIEDNAQTANAIQDVAHALGYKTEIANSCAQARSMINTDLPEIVLLDLELPDEDGVELMREFVEYGVEDYIVISAATEQNRILDTLRAGANEFLSKPVRLSEIRAAIERTEQHRYARLAGTAVPSAGAWVDADRNFGDTRAALELRSALANMAQKDALRMFVIGEPGTRKCNVAAAIHQQSGRAGQLVTVNCAQEIDDNAWLRFVGRETDMQSIAKVLPGYFKQAQGGTLVLDDISRLPLALQSMLVSTIDSLNYTPVNAHEKNSLNSAIICIARESLSDAAAAHRLSQDLFYSMSANTIDVPSLNACFSANASLAETHVQRLNISTGKDKCFSPEAVQRINDYHWPGNFRELANCVKAAYYSSAGRQIIHADDLSIDGVGSVSPNRAISFVGLTFKQLEEKHIKATLNAVNGNKTRAAEQLGISVKTLYNRLAVYC